jgi:DNA (cytosine-5)-methyltransferase 1
MTLTFGSLFAGIGGIDLGLERAGMQCAWQVEIDDYATRVLTKHWPNVPRYRDVRSVGAHNLARVDLICGGFPCQDISSAGQRAGITGTRSGLWAEFARIIGDLRPRYVLVENVAALLHRGIDRVLGDLSTLGFDAEWHCLPAAAFGAPHIRDRVYIVAYAQRDRWQQGTEVLSTRQSLTATSSEDVADASRGWGSHQELCTGRPELGRSGADVSDSSIEGVRQLAARQQGQQAAATDSNRRSQAAAYSDIKQEIRFTAPRQEHSCWRIEPDVGRVAHGVPARVDRLRGLGNAVVPQAAEYIGRLIVAHEAQI